MSNMAGEAVVSNDYTQSAEMILVRVEGKIDRMNDRLARSEKDFMLVSQDVRALMSRVDMLEAKESERKGFSAAWKTMWALLGALGGSGILIIARIITKGAI